ncbi:MAG: ethanolamine utilization protein EutN [Verrucomicrobia bacterium]|nr:ethanolamine utilization protein EutN [Verrucomicrobiota bacterium]MCH8510147.1 ethanolamine utilization protein EutN [Kiritimatiellia bacterium]
MKIGYVIGRVTCNHKLDAYKGGRFFLVLPATKEQLLRDNMEPLPPGNSLIVFDVMGATIGDRIAFSEGGEAAMSFPGDTPVDAYNCMILDKISYHPPQNQEKS